MHSDFGLYSIFQHIQLIVFYKFCQQLTASLCFLKLEVEFYQILFRSPKELIKNIISELVENDLFQEKWPFSIFSQICDFSKFPLPRFQCFCGHFDEISKISDRSRLLLPENIKLNFLYCQIIQKINILRFLPCTDHI